jgi:hypothetical protein
VFCSDSPRFEHPNKIDLDNQIDAAIRLEKAQIWTPNELGINAASRL